MIIICNQILIMMKSLKIPKGQSETVNRRPNRVVLTIWNVFMILFTLTCM